MKYLLPYCTQTCDVIPMPVKTNCRMVKIGNKVQRIKFKTISSFVLRLNIHPTRLHK